MRDSLDGGPERSKLRKWSWDCGRNTKVLEVSESQDGCQRELHGGSGTSSREKSILQAVKLEGQNHVGP